MHRLPLSLEAVDLETARDGWDALADAARNPFATPEWVTTWTLHYADAADVRVWRVHDGDRLVALIPLVRETKGGVGFVRFAGHGPADLLGPVCAREDVPLAAEALRRIADGLASREILLAELLAGEDGYPEAVRGRPLRRHESPLLAIEGDWDAWLATKSSNFRGQVRRSERRLARDHELRFRLADDPGRLDEDMETLFELHEARWATEGGTLAFAADRRAFHRDFARVALERGWLRLWIAEVDGRPAAAWYGLRHAGRDWFYQMGRDPSFDRYKVGFVLLAHTIRDAFEAGVDAYQFGLGPETYKARFASGDPGLDTVVLGHRPLVALTAGAFGAVRRLPPRPRAMIKRYAT